MRHRHGGVLLGVVLTLMTPATWARAAEPDVTIVITYSPAYAACVDKAGGVTSSTVDCINTEIALWDGRLNAAYRILMGRPAISEPVKVELRDAQRAWIAFRQKTCTAEGDLAADGGTLARIVADGCFLDETAKRVTSLEAAVANP